VPKLLLVVLLRGEKRGRGADEPDNVNHNPLEQGQRNLQAFRAYDQTCLAAMLP